MNVIVQNYLKNLKSKQLKDWTPNELYDHALDLLTIYTYCKDEEDRYELSKVYDKIVAWINPQKRGMILNPGAIANIDKHHK